MLVVPWPNIGRRFHMSLSECCFSLNLTRFHTKFDIRNSGRNSGFYSRPWESYLLNDLPVEVLYQNLLKYKLLILTEMDNGMELLFLVCKMLIFSSLLNPLVLLFSEKERKQLLTCDEYFF